MTHHPIEHPDHYTRNGVECIEIIEALGLGFHRGNALKYLWRAGHKGDPLEDLKKARWYIDREIARIDLHHPEANLTPTSRNNRTVHSKE